MLSVIRKWLGLDEISQRLAHITEDQVDIFRRLRAFDDLNRLDIDASFRGQCTIVLTGVFQGKGYVKFYDVDQREFEYLVREFRERKKHSLLRNVDAPPSFYGAFDL